MTIDRNDPDIQTLFETLDAQLETERVDRGVPGLSVAIVHDQDIVWARGFRYVNLEAGIPADPQTVYRVGSVTKLFTATMLMQLRDAGKLCLDDPVEQYMPAFRLKTRLGEASAPTSRQIASHTAGLPLTVKQDLYRIAQEALQNTVKQAQASKVHLVLRCMASGVMLEVRDDGVGFDPTGSFPGHFGPRSLQERVQNLG
jgi:CubicO group peptidase (beta-lactamase class C family)